MADAAFKDVPELFENELGEVLMARTETLATFRELGPPDLCHVVKSTGRSGQKDLGSYHYVSGVDASSSASLAAYINSLTYSIDDNSTWFSKSTAWKVRSGCYCCFNAFSRVDVRVDVKIPGGVLAYVIDLRGERHDTTPEIWQETYLSALLRAILYGDDPTFWLEAYRRLDPLTTREGEIRFLEAAEALFAQGWQVGSDPEIQVASVVSNHLTAGIMKYFGDSFRLQQAANLFEKVSVHEPEVSSLLAKSYIGMNEEVKAVQIMANALRDNPQSYTLLHAQCDFLRSKGKYDWALKLARQAVNCAPSEFVTWEKLTMIYTELGQYDSALLTLNSCPMFTYNGRDAHRNITPARINLPYKPAIADILPERHKTEDDEADTALQRLPAPGLKGTWARAYALLTKLVSKIGWDELLKTRSAVFVMEEEYRMQKAQSDMRVVTKEETGKETVIHEDGTVAPSSSKLGADDDASTRGVVSPASEDDEEGNDEASVDGDAPATTEGQAKSDLNVGEIPMIKISTESDREREHESMREMNGAEKKEQSNGQAGHAAGSSVERPVQAASGENNDADGDVASSMTAVSGSGSMQDGFSFSNKRLCERWLDNLFMVLYEDLRIWTIFRAEVAHFKTQHVAYRKTGLEWEILGELGSRLHHREEAKECFQRCLESNRYSVKPWLRLMEMYAEEGDLTRTLQTAIRVAAYAHNEYAESSYPTTIAHQLFKLGRIHGHGKISYTLLSMGLPDPIMKVMEGYLNYGQVFQVEGYDF
ncbi:chaps-domain-containing protein [Fomitiporia mediterranea MF3/22]|uniref:chaps-domain-containing protein n=1 Tax=Fomitiporia mediterranea (strain MF3/22) TaxID=694068 RepID=UPI0004407DA1|nr:chaps-domain-containing protein [Fomitiporia mediterranea MF3/22]EJD05520.1 chaps-domain-containing protein [Fomitiporia mediterranea MF3/22]